MVKVKQKICSDTVQKNKKDEDIGAVNCNIKISIEIVKESSEIYIGVGT